MAEKFDFDLNLRDQSDMTSDKFISKYCEVFRPHAMATVDDSLNEFEKLITHVLTVKCGYDALTGHMGVTNVYLGDAIERHESGADLKGCEVLIDAAKDAVRALSAQIYDTLKAGEFGGHADEDELRGMAHTLALMKIGG